LFIVSHSLIFFEKDDYNPFGESPIPNIFHDLVQDGKKYGVHN